MTREKAQTRESATEEPKVSIFLAWCKRCGNCVTFCPTGALESDEWGYPYVAQPDRCTRCHLCEMLCPDFAIGVGEASDWDQRKKKSRHPAPGEPGSPVSMNHSPERLAPDLRDEDS